MSVHTVFRRWASQQAAAEYAGVTDRTIRNYIARGELTGYRVGKGRLVRVDLNELDALLRPIPTAGGGKHA
ncbi:MAG: helix-turn-helix domain-containing protein [Nocardioides sp.]